MNTFKKFASLSFTLVIMLFMSSCVDKEFDEPPIDGTDPELTATHTIAQIKALYVAGQASALPDTAIFAGVVISDDVEGNFYKDLVLEDSTGGILIRVDVSPLSPLYGKGRRIFVKCAGLSISDYGGMLQLGIKDGTSVGRIPSTFVPNYLVRGMWNQPFPITTVSDFSTLNPASVNNQNIAVKLENVTFLEPCNTWADMVNQFSGNRALEDANGNQIIVRTSNFSTFGGAYVPSGTGTVTGVLQVYNGSFQLILRDLNDLTGFIPANCQPVNSIEELKGIWGGTTKTIPDGSVIEGVVISDKTTGNITSNNVVIQQGSFGIVVRFTSPNTFSLGDKISINVGNQELSEFNSLLQVNNVDITLATLTGTGTITPRVATTADINANGEAWESTLVTINNVTISGSGTYSGTTTLTDAVGTLPMFTRSAASFSGTAYPATVVNITGLVSDFNGRQLNIRNLSDVQ